VLTIATLVVSLFILALAVWTVPVGAGYAIWPDIGAVGRTRFSIILYAEPMTAWHVVCLLPIEGGIVGHKFTAS
jgi:quaternary ammonium compound-resistance protein SugE